MRKFISEKDYSTKRIEALLFIITKASQTGLIHDFVWKAFCSLFHRIITNPMN